MKSSNLWRQRRKFRVFFSRLFVCLTTIIVIFHFLPLSLVLGRNPRGAIKYFIFSFCLHSRGFSLFYKLALGPSLRRSTRQRFTQKATERSVSRGNQVTWNNIKWTNEGESKETERENARNPSSYSSFSFSFFSPGSTFLAHLLLPL